MSNRLYQSIIHQMKDAVQCRIGVIDESGTIISCSELGKIGETVPGAIVEVFSANGPVTVGEYVFHSFGSPIHPEYAAFVENSDPRAASFAAMLAIALSNVKQYYDEKYDKRNFIKNVLLDNILPGDVYLKAKELHFNDTANRVVLLLRVTEKTDVVVFDLVQELFPEKNRDFIINISESDIAIVKEVRPGIDAKDLDKLARSVVDSLGAEFYSKVLVGIGTVTTGIKELARSFKEAQVALEVGKVFDTEKTIVNYDNLGIARLIYQLPTTLCEMFLREIFRRGSIDSLDQETLFTIQKFFENNLNVSETSRKLFVHRNTLVYRLEKIRKLTGLDLREFDDAIVFKVALMVKKYLDSNPAKF
ncbi:MAG: helix-turn-helix domain-containing protein [Clostridia bacterium]|nr:helix-turn-helix domain-containing protein [Clostridia bacterium]